MELPITLLIPCKNEEQHIRECILSAQELAAEVLVADSGSTDDTLCIARDLGARIIERDYVNPSDFKNWAIPKASHPWILLLDADERATPELLREIRELWNASADAPSQKAYRIRRINHLFGKPVRHSGWQNDGVIRLFLRDECRYRLVRVHEELEVPATSLGHINAPLLHFTYHSYSQILEKYDRYSSWAAEDLRDQGHKASVVTLLLRPTWRFVRHYLIQGGFRDGLAGLIISAMAGFYVFLKYAKLWQMTLRNRPS